MSTPCYYCELDPGSCELCIHEVNIEDLLQQARREGWEQGKREAATICNTRRSDYGAGGEYIADGIGRAIAAMEYKGDSK